ncbi:uncharacterized protein L969DRAFT_83957 [Mixia osmundae IAM 14324]|nr:uncharacterized protein L969DRAFT_83957 [Mixia osmundae IAM 14324]KEI42092.1 hypothetical protein L969DRAFT_83957 [Mixia osmundae IAM 14324]
MAGAPDSARPAQPATPAGNENSPTRTSSDPRRAAADAAERRARGEPLQPAADDATATTTRTATFTFENGRGVTMHGTLDGDGSRDGAPVPVRQLSDFLAGAFGAPAADPSAPGEQGERRTDQPTSFSEQLLAMLGIRAEGGAFRSEGSGFQFYFGGGGRMGQFGDYVSEQGLQNVLTELMEQAQGQHGPAPATEEVIAELPRCKLTTEMLAHDTMTSCPICQDDFQIDEMAIKLPKPCNHVFHQDCLTPWLKTSGTCPVCRYELVPQPSHARPDSGGPHTPRSPAVPNEHRPASLSPVVEGSRLPGEFPFFQGAIRPPAPGPRPPQNLPPQDDVD